MVLRRDQELMSALVDISQMLLEFGSMLLTRNFRRVGLAPNWAALNNALVQEVPSGTSVVSPVRSTSRAYNVYPLRVRRIYPDRVDAETDRAETPVDAPVVPLGGCVQPCHLFPSLASAFRAEQVAIVRPSIEGRRGPRIDRDSPDLPHMQSTVDGLPGPPEVTGDEHSVSKSCCVEFFPLSAVGEPVDALPPQERPSLLPYPPRLI